MTAGLGKISGVRIPDVPIAKLAAEINAAVGKIPSMITYKHPLLVGFFSFLGSEGAGEHSALSTYRNFPSCRARVIYGLFAVIVPQIVVTGIAPVVIQALYALDKDCRVLYRESLAIGTGSGSNTERTCADGRGLVMRSDTLRAKEGILAAPLVKETQGVNVTLGSTAC